MKQSENTIAVKVAEYRLYITRLRVCRDSLARCCGDTDRRGWRLGALEQLSKASSLNCQTLPIPASFNRPEKVSSNTSTRFYQKAIGAVICLHPLPRQNFEVSV